MPTDLVFRGLDLRGKSFRDQDLTGADFSSADVRGADFTDARLVQANFTDARLGVRPLTGLLILVGALLVSIAAGVTIGYLADASRDRATSSDWRDVLAGSLLVVTVVVFLAFLVLKGIRRALRAFLIVFISVIVVDFVVVFLFAGELRLREGLPVIGLLLLFGPATVAGVLGRVVGGAFGSWAIAIVAVLGGLAAGRSEGGFAAIVVSVLLVVVSKRALKLDERDRPLRQFAHRIVTHRGTRFTGADISGADFTGTLVAQSDVSHATLDGATWERGKGPATIAATES